MIKNELGAGGRRKPRRQVGVKSPNYSQPRLRLFVGVAVSREGVEREICFGDAEWALIREQPLPPFRLLTFQ